MTEVLAKRLAIAAAAATPVTLALCATAFAAGERAREAMAAGARGGRAADAGSALNVATDLGAVIVLGVGLAMVGLALAIVPGLWRSRRHGARPSPVASARRA
ncbi:MAG TPA: hypothetical protein VIL04_02265 [Solirubrobacterales bacterium]|jgi:hypothetical protein